MDNTLGNEPEQTTQVDIIIFILLYYPFKPEKKYIIYVHRNIICRWSLPDVYYYSNSMLIIITYLL